MKALTPSSSWRIGLEVCALLLTALAGVWFFLPGHFGAWRLLCIAMPPAALAALLLYLAGEDVLSGWFVLWKTPWICVVLCLSMSFYVYLVVWRFHYLEGPDGAAAGVLITYFRHAVSLFEGRIFAVLLCVLLYEYAFRVFLLVRLRRYNPRVGFLVVAVCTMVVELLCLHLLALHMHDGQSTAFENLPELPLLLPRGLPLAGLAHWLPGVGSVEAGLEIVLAYALFKAAQTYALNIMLLGSGVMYFGVLVLVDTALVDYYVTPFYNYAVAAAWNWTAFLGLLACKLAYFLALIMAICLCPGILRTPSRYTTAAIQSSNAGHYAWSVRVQRDTAATSDCLKRCFVEYSVTHVLKFVLFILYALVVAWLVWKGKYPLS